MPLYEYQCPGGHIFDEYRPIDQCREPILCREHDQYARRILSKTRVVGDYETYRCPVSGRPISGRRQHEENLRRTGSRVLEPGERLENERRRAVAEDHMDREIEQTIGETVESWPAEKQAKLAQELEHFTVEVKRESPNV